MSRALRGHFFFFCRQKLQIPGKNPFLALLTPPYYNGFVRPNQWEFQKGSVAVSTYTQELNGHLRYSRAVKRLIRKHLAADFPPDRAEALWADVHRIYLEFLTDLPALGGRKNMQAGSVYDCIALFAYYEALPEKPTLAEFEHLNNELFLPPMKARSFLNLNWRFAPRAAHCIYALLARSIKKHAADWPGNYHMEVPPFDPALGVRFHFTTCPIADFARKHGYTHLMPALCNPDYPMLAALHGTLIRTTTCANGDCCDYRIVGDQSPLAREHPLERDDAGYLRNR